MGHMGVSLRLATLFSGCLEREKEKTTNPPPFCDCLFVGVFPWGGGGGGGGWFLGPPTHHFLCVCVSPSFFRVGGGRRGFFETRKAFSRAPHAPGRGPGAPPPRLSGQPPRVAGRAPTISSPPRGRFWMDGGLVVEILGC